MQTRRFGRFETKGAAIAFAAIVALLPILYLWVHEIASFVFPLPWPDESSFLWPAIAVQERWTLFTPELNPERHVMWMPPGYAIVMGSIFKLTGFSLEWARMLSAIFMLGAFACLAGVARRLRRPVAAALLVASVFADRFFVLTGNFARMEALLVLAIACAALLLVRGHRAKALAVLLACPLIHPNGLYPAAGLGLYLAWRFARGHRARPSRADTALFAVVGLLWAAYAAYVAQHWSDFLSDMRFQLVWKDRASPLDVEYWLAWVEPGYVAATVLMGVLAGLAAAMRSPGARLMVLALVLQLMPVTSIEWYYQVFRGLAFAISGIVALDLSGRAVERFAPARPIARMGAGIATLALVMGAGFAGGWIEDPRGYPNEMKVAYFRMGESEPYLDAEDERAVRAFLESLGSPEVPVTVRFSPWADALLFHDLRSERLRFIQPTLGKGAADFAIIHLTHLIPKMGRFYDPEKVAERVRGFPRIRVRSRTDQWLYEIAPEPMTHGKLRKKRPDRRERDASRVEPGRE